jgi:hypothetical protein
MKLQSRLLFLDFKDKIYRRKTRPSELRPEDLYDENLSLKAKLNQLEQHVTQQKTQNRLLNNELEK